MSLVKGFDEFLLEGKYDSLTGEIAYAVMRKIKETNTGEEEFDGIKIIYGPGDDVPSFNEMIENEEYLEVDYFIDPVSGIDVRVYISIVRDESPEYQGEFILDGETDDQNSFIYLYLYLTPGTEPRVYPEIAIDLRNLIRHEVEHLTQRGWEKKKERE